MNIRKSQLKEMIKAVAREAINERKEKWLKGAVNKKHKGFCTPMSKKTCTPKRKALAKRFKKGLEEGENPFKGKEKEENPFKKKEEEEPEELETPEDSDEKSSEEPDDTEAPTNMVSDEEPEDSESDSNEPVGPPEDIGGEEEPDEESHGYDEKEEILLIKVLEKAVQKLLDMHKGMEGSEEEPPVDVGEPEGEEIPLGEPSIDSDEPEGEEIPVEEPPVDAGGAEGEEAPVEEDEEEQGLEEGGSVQYESAPPGFGPGKVHADIYNKVEAQYGKDSPKKYATLWKIYNQMTEVANAALEECGGMEEAGLTSEDSESKTTPLDDIVRLVKNKGLEDPEKEKYLVSHLFKHQTGWNVDPQTLEKALQKGNTEETLNEASYKVAAPHSYTDAAEDKARTIQTDPEVNEMFAAGENNTCPKCQTSLKESDEGKLRCDNPMCECSKKLYEFTKRNFKEPEIKENHKVQARSYTTANDGAQDPKNVRDPEVPGP